MPEIAQLSSVTIGDTTVTFLPDGGGVVNPTALYPASTEAGWNKYQNLLNDEGKFITSIGAFLIETKARKIAVDLGIGPVSLDFPGFGPFSGGKYLDSLAKTGVDPADISNLVFSHLHVDHVGWTTVPDEEGQRRLLFPNATVNVTETEWTFWHGGDNPAGPHPELVQAPIADRLEFIKEGDTLAPGITVLSTPGHTPGHISLLIERDGQQLYLLADVIHGVMQLQEKDWNVAFDVDPEQARRSREKLYPELLAPNTLVVANHFSNNVFGRIREVEGQLGWEPLTSASGS